MTGKNNPIKACKIVSFAKPSERISSAASGSPGWPRAAVLLGAGSSEVPDALRFSGC